MKILEILKNVDLVIADIEVNLGKEKHNNPTLCVKKGNKVIPLSTPGARPILRKEENSIQIDDDKD